ncbi:MAG: hypothetical protein PHT60_15340 [Acidiphilium sp.]|nr:hypothetical protein [Acidiphilium sp.]
MTKLFYVPGSTHAIDYAREIAGQYVSVYGGRTLAELAEEYPGVVLGDEDSFIEQQERALSTDPKEITETQFMDALEMLPPLHWMNHGAGESFKCPEFIAGNITTIYARLNGRYWSFQGVATLPHVAIMERIARAEAGTAP